MSLSISQKSSSLDSLIAFIPVINYYIGNFYTGTKITNISSLLLRIILAPIIVPIFLIISYTLRSKAVDLSNRIKDVQINSEEEYDLLLKLYSTLLRIDSDQVIDPSEVYFPMKLLTNQLNAILRLVSEAKTALGEKLYILPKGVTSEQIAESAKLNKGIEGLFDDEEDYLYSKALALGQLEFQETTIEIKSKEDFEILTSALENPPAPNIALLNAAQRYKKVLS